MSQDAPLSDSLELIHADWTLARNQALTELFEGLAGAVPEWFEKANEAEPSEGAVGAGFWIGVATTVAACVDADGLAAAGYLMLAERLKSGEGPNPAARLWYLRSLRHAQLAGDDFRAAAAAYCLGAIEEEKGAIDEAREHLLAALDHAKKAGNHGGQAASLFRLSCLAMARWELKTASDLALDSYRISMDAKQLVPATETITTLMRFYHDMGFDDLAVTPAVHHLSCGIHRLSEGDQSLGQTIAAACLRAIAVLGPESQDRILHQIDERYGPEIEKVFREQLAAIVAEPE